MDYEKKYKEALKDMRAIYPNLKGDAKIAVEHAFPELAESDDERIRKLLVWQVHRNIEDETNDLAGSVYDGIKGHDPDLEESIEDWKKCLAWLEKQKEPKHDATDAKSERVIKAARSVLNNWLDGTDCPDVSGDFAELEYAIREYDGEEKQKEQKPAECIEDSVKYEEGFKAGRESGLRDGQKYVLNNLDSYGLCKPAEWSDEDEKKITFLERLIRYNVPEGEYGWVDGHKGGFITKSEAISKLKSLRPQPQGTYKQVIHTIFGMLKDKDFYEIQPSDRVSLLNDIRVKCKDAIECAPILDEPQWKPSEEQMEALKRASVNEYIPAKQFDILVSLYKQLKKLM